METKKKDGRRVTIIVPVARSVRNVLQSTLASFFLHSDPDWQLIVVKIGDFDLKLTVSQVADSRLRVVTGSEMSEMQGILKALAFTAAEYCGVLMPGDTLAAGTCRHISDVVSVKPSPELVYGDEQCRETNKEIRKGSWAPELLLCRMYIGGFYLLKKNLLLSTLHKSWAGTSDWGSGYAVLLHLRSRLLRVTYVPEVLSTRYNKSLQTVDLKKISLVLPKKYLLESQQTAETQKVIFSKTHREPITLLFVSGEGRRDIPGKGKTNLLMNALDSIASKSSYPDYRVIVVANRELSAEVTRKIRGMPGQVYLHRTAEPFNYPAQLNFGLGKVTTPKVIILNDDVEVISEDWIERLEEWLDEDSVGAVGAKLLYPDGSVQHAGLRLCKELGATHSYYKVAANGDAAPKPVSYVRNCSALTAAVLATRMDVVREIGFFDEQLAHDFNDVDFCLKLTSSGYRLVWTPYAELLHYEGSTLKRTRQNPYEVDLFKSRWSILLQTEPYPEVA